MTVALTNQTYTFDEYLAIEELATEKHEYKNGEIISMTGGTTAATSI
jgi:Uma2 family endonuclease